MNETVSKITVLFEEPFWICVYEREFCGQYEVSKITFGAEPRDYQVYDFLLKNYKNLSFSPPMKSKINTQKSINPKRMARIIKKEMMASTTVGTKAQEALKLQRAEGKTERKVRSKEEKERQKEFLFELKQKKRKEKHKGH